MQYDAKHREMNIGLLFIKQLRSIHKLINLNVKNYRTRATADLSVAYVRFDTSQSSVLLSACPDSNIEIDVSLNKRLMFLVTLPSCRYSKNKDERRERQKSLATGFSVSIARALRFLHQNAKHLNSYWESFPLCSCEAKSSSIVSHCTICRTSRGTALITPVAVTGGTQQNVL